MRAGMTSGATRARARGPRERDGVRTGVGIRSRNSLTIGLVALLGTGLAACGNVDDPDDLGGDTDGGTLPVALNGCDYVTLNQPVSGVLQASDPAGGQVTFSIVDLPAKGALTLTNPLTGEFVYEPNFNARGTDSFIFQAHNGDGSSEAATHRLVHMPRVMPLGDSITWGVTDGDGANPPLEQRVGYRKAVRDALHALGYRIDFVGTLQSGADPDQLADDPDHEGHGGWRADELVNGRDSVLPGTGNGKLSEWLHARAPDIVLLHAGTNDLNGNGDPGIEAQDIEQILATINKWESSHWPVTVVLSRIIINHQKDPQHTIAFNDRVIGDVAVPHIASGDEVIWVDHESALDDFRFYADSLHPNEAGYERMAEVWLHPLAGAGRPSGSHAGEGILPRCP